MPRVQVLFTGVLVSLSGLVNIWKHSDRCFLQVIVGSKVIAPLLCLAVLLFVLRLLVRERPSWLSPGCMGLSFEAMPSILVCASVAHDCGFLHPFRLSLMQSWHIQCGP
jgi:hypothetical protein